MAIKFQYNKTSLQTLEKQLKVRERALPTLKNKESALRIEVKRAQKDSNAISEKLSALKDEYDPMAELWCEFDSSLLSIKKIDLGIKKIAGVKTPYIDHIEFEVKDFDVFSKPKWFYDGIEVLKKMIGFSIEKDVYLKKMELLDHARKKTTQKVNLFEKVQIPEHKEAITKIKRFLEDEENLSKAAQKIVKNRQEAEARQ